VFAQSEKPKGKLEATPDPLAELVQVLNHKTVKFDGPLKPRILRQIVEDLESQFDKKVKFVVREDLFRATGNPDLENIREKVFQSDNNLTGLTLHDFLRESLAEFRAGYLVRKNHLEIVPLAELARQFDARPVSEDEDPQYVREQRALHTPLVNAVFKDKPLAETLSELERVYDRTILVTANAAELALTPVSARLMNVPLSAAVRELAEGCGLQVRETDGMIVVSAKAKKERKK
jgi:hypothetical protein